MTPKILLVSTCRWFATARLAAAFVGAGCDVDVLCPRGHPIAKTRSASRLHMYYGLNPGRSVRAAVEAANADFIIPCDDFATALLHRLYAEARCMGAAGAATCALLKRSLGEPSSFPIISSRTPLIALAHDLGIKVPVTAVVRTMPELTEWVQQHGFPAVLKVDGTYGARGVRIIHRQTDAWAAFRTLSVPPSAARALKRAIVNRDTNYLLPFMRRTRPVVSAQCFVSGQNANVAVACWKGEVLASITVAVLHTLDANGPASVVRMIDNREMSKAAERIVSSLKVSGLVGFDFIIEKPTGDAYLIEMNPRATQIGHLPLGSGRDLPASLRAILSGEPLRELLSVATGDVIALFPQEWLRDPGSPFLKTAYHDVPWEQPEFLRACLEEPSISRIWTGISTKTHFARLLEGKSARFGQTRNRMT